MGNVNEKVVEKRVVSLDEVRERSPMEAAKT